MINEPREEYHPYDRALKSLMGDHARQLLPELLPGCEVEEEENTELNQTTLRADLVYNVRYKGQAARAGSGTANPTGERDGLSRAGLSRCLIWPLSQTGDLAGALPV